MLSIGTGVGPPVTRIGIFLRQDELTARHTAKAIAFSSGKLFFPLATLGGIISTPMLCNCWRESVKIELCKLPCIVGAIKTLVFPRSILPIAEPNADVITPSAIPKRILLIVL